jgi:hypothetical protein
VSGASPVRVWCIEEELQRATPPTDPDLDRAQAILEDISRFWDAEPEPAERRKLLLSLFAQIWAKDNQIVAVKPNPAFANYFTAASEVRARTQKPTRGMRQQIRESDGGPTLVRHHIEIRTRDKVPVGLRGR